MKRPARNYLVRMTNKQKFLNFLGIAQGAGKIISGENSLLRSIRVHQIKYLVIASDAGAATSKKFHDKAQSYRIVVNDRLSQNEISRAIGSLRVVVGICDQNFAKRLIELQTKFKGQ